MKINYYWGFFELEAEDTRDQAWLESWVEANYKYIEFDFVNDEGKPQSGKDYDKEVDVVTKVVIGQS